MFRRAALGIVCLAFSFAHADPVVEADTAAATGESQFGTAEKVLKNLIEPMMTGVLMSSLDGSKQFSTQVGCRANSAFMEMLIHPSATGDIDTVQVQVDTNVDGTLDATLVVPNRVSGVCGNGFISCDAGTWNNCMGYQWTTDATGMAGVTPTSVQNLGGCYCINNHCGAGLSAMNLGPILETLGGGVAGALMKRNPAFVVTSTSLAPPIISFNGQHTQGCAVGTTTATNYASNPSQLSTDAFATAATNTTFQLIQGSPAAAGTGSTVNSCSIERNVALDEVSLSGIVDYTGGQGSVTSCGGNCLRLSVGQVGDNYLGGHCAYYTQNATFNIYRPDRITSAVVERAKFDDYMQVIINGQVVWNGPDGNWTSPTGTVPGACERYSSWDFTPNADIRASLVNPGVYQFATRTEVSGNGEGFALLRIEADTSCRLLADTISNNCSALQTNPSCQLEEETVDGVKTINNFISTGLVPLAQSRAINGATCTQQVTRDWFVKQRKYRCTNASPYDFTRAMDRKAYIDSHSTSTTYADRRETSPGTFVETSGALPGAALSALVTVQPCTQVCKASYESVANDVGNTTVALDQRPGTPTKRFVYHECNAAGACPLEAGETQEKDCACINEWAEAATIMQIMRMAGSDFTCSSGTKN